MCRPNPAKTRKKGNRKTLNPETHDISSTDSDIVFVAMDQMPVLDLELGLSRSLA